MCSSSLSLSNSSFGSIGIVTYISLNIMHVVPGLLFHVLNTQTQQTLVDRIEHYFAFSVKKKKKEKRPADVRLYIMMEASSVVLAGQVGRNLLEREACKRANVANKICFRISVCSTSF